MGKKESPDVKETKGEDICRRTFEFAVEIIRTCRILERNTDISRNLGRQLLRSGVSIGADVEEGQGAQSKADFIHKLAVARKEARETSYWLRLLDASEILPVEKSASLLGQCNELIAILTTIIKKCENNLRKKRIKT